MGFVSMHYAIPQSHTSVRHNEREDFICLSPSNRILTAETVFV